MRLVHVQTTIQTVFGLLDDDGNALPQQPITATVSKFSTEAFTEAHAAIAAERDKALAGTPDEQDAAPKPRARPRR